MEEPQKDRHQIQAQRRFLEEIEMTIRAANREIIHDQIPSLNKDAFYRLAIMVAKQRAHYLEAVMKMDWEENPESLKVLESRREAYEETLKGFEALTRTIERGYVSIA